MNPLEFKVDDLLELMAREGRSHFAPSYVCNRLGTEKIQEVTQYLLSVVNRKLISYWEVECPNHDSDFVVEDPRNLPTGAHICHQCGVEYEPSPDRIWLAFDFTISFREHVKKRIQF